MQVYVKLFARLREHLPPEARGTAVLELSDGCTVADLLSELDLSDQARIVLVNGRQNPGRTQTLQHGDAVHLFPAAGGG